MNYYNAAVGHEGSIAHAWSLAVEEQFYLIWPLAFLFLARGGIDRVRRVLAVTIVAVMLWRSFLYVVVDTGSPYVYNAFDTRFDSIALGCLIAAWATSETFVRTARALATRLAPLLTIAAIFATRHFMHSTYHYTIGLTLEAVLLGLLILQLMQLTSSPMWSWLESAPLRYIGLISYPIYLWHQLAIDFSHKLVTGMPARIALGFAAVVVVASGSYYFIEKPMLALRKHKRVLSPLTPAKYES
jgi:peptidoglycan/LPS O-acetylase OafA/YrhL